MKRNQKNYQLLWDLSNHVGGLLSARTAGKRPKFPKAYSKELRNSLRNLAWLDQITGVGIGLKTSGPDNNQSSNLSELCLQFTVRRKVATGRLDRDHLIPKFIRLEHLGRNIPTDVIAAPALAVAHAPALAGRLAAQNIGPMGAVTAVATDDANQAYSIGCAHVLVPPSNPETGIPIESPPDNNSSTIANPIGGLFAWVDLQNSPGLLLDAALVKLDSPSQASNTFPDGSSFGPVVPHSDVLHQPVRMFRSSIQNWAFGSVFQANYSQLISYSDFGNITVNGLYVILINNSEGDSGSPVFLDNNERGTLSMHIAGDNRSLAFSTPFVSVLDNWGLTLI